MDQQLSTALAAVLADVRSCGVPVPRVEDEPWGNTPGMATAMMHSSDGSATGVSVDADDSPAAQLARVADQVQDWVIEQLWSSGPTNWPRCPLHPSSHPMTAAVSDGAAVWTCPVTATVVCAVGSLDEARR